MVAAPYHLQNRWSLTSRRSTTRIGNINLLRHSGSARFWSVRMYLPSLCGRRLLGGMGVGSRTFSVHWLSNGCLSHRSPFNDRNLLQHFLRRRRAWIPLPTYLAWHQQKTGKKTHSGAVKARHSSRFLRRVSHPPASIVLVLSPSLRHRARLDILPIVPHPVSPQLIPGSVFSASNTTHSLGNTSLLLSILLLSTLHRSVVAHPAGLSAICEAEKG